jgi:hypothetical protein
VIGRTVKVDFTAHRTVILACKPELYSGNKTTVKGGTQKAL